ncbi:hypothetical protein SNEBB_011392 [Seison nebaliae]|nr:hypothetical protein SNEBB_011392 [Seison nebaliae]
MTSAFRRFNANNYLFNRIPSTSSINSIDCGESAILNERKGRVLFGIDSIPHSFPWIVQIRSLIRTPQQSFMITVCGGTLIDNQHILTAAHCVEKHPIYEVEPIDILLGSHYSNNIHYRQQSKNIVYRRILAIYKFPLWHIENNIEHDIAIIRIGRIRNFNDIVRPICIPNTIRFRLNESVVAAGWGFTRSPSIMLKTYKRYGMNSLMKPIALQRISLPIRKWSMCKQLPLHSTHICAGTINSSVCSGDSGGPLMKYDVSIKKWILIGVVSNGDPTCSKPSLFINVSMYYWWIGLINEYDTS